MILNLQIPHAHSIKIKEPCPDAMWCWGQPLNRLGKATELRKFKGILNNAVLDLDSRSIGPSIPAPFSGSSHSHIEVHTNCQVLLALFSNMCSFCTKHMVVYCSLTLNHTMKFEAFMIFFLLQVSQTKKISCLFSSSESIKTRSCVATAERWGVCVSAKRTISWVGAMPRLLLTPLQWHL